MTSEKDTAFLNERAAFMEVRPAVMKKLEEIGGGLGMTPEEQAEFLETFENIGAGGMRLLLELKLSWIDSEGNFREPTVRDVLGAKPITEETIYEYFVESLVAAEEALERGAPEDLALVREELQKGALARIALALSPRGKKPRSDWDAVRAIGRIAVNAAKKRKSGRPTEADIRAALDAKALSRELHIDYKSAYPVLRRHTDDEWVDVVRKHILLYECCLLIPS
jgi:hypothetical protein